MKKLITLTFILLISGVMTAQNVRYQLSTEKVKEKRLVKPTFIGEMNDNIYVATRTLTTHKRKLQDDLKISVYNKATNKLVKSISIKGFANKKCFAAIKDAEPNNCVLRNESLYVSWVVKTKTETKLLLQIFDSKMNEIQKPQVIYQLANKKNSGSNAQLFFLMSPDGNKIAIGGEGLSENKGLLELQYKVYNQEMEVLNSVQVEMPFTVVSSNNETSSDYELNNAGFLYFSTNVSIHDDEGSKKGTSGYLIGKINPENGALTKQTVAIKGKSLTSFHYKFVDKKINVYGIAEEPKKLKKTQYRQSGFYTVTLEEESLKQIGDLKNVDFDVNKIGYSDFEMSKKEKEQFNKDEFILSKMKNLVILDFTQTSDNGMLIAMNSQYFYTICSTDKLGTVCQKFTEVEGRFYAKLNQSGELDWISCCEQNFTQPKYVYPSNKLIKKNDSYCAIVKETNRHNTFITIDEKSGQIARMEFPKKYKDETFGAYNDKIYYLGLKRRLSRTGVIGTCASVATLPLAIGLFGVFIFPNYKRNNVFFGSFEIQ